VLSLGACKLKMEEMCTLLLENASVPHIKSLMKRNTGWDDLQLQAKLKENLKEDWAPFRDAVNALNLNFSYLKRKLAIPDGFMVRYTARIGKRI
jgi:hypothetical protein